MAQSLKKQDPRPDILTADPQPTEGYWKTEDGEKARVYTMDGGGEFPVHGAILGKGGVWEVTLWRRDGKAGASPFGGDNIVGRWAKPVCCVIWVVIWRNGAITNYRYSPDLSRSTGDVVAVKKVELEYVEGVYDY